MVKYYVKGEIIGNNEKSVKKINDKKVEKVFITVKNPIFCDSKGNEIESEKVLEIVDKIKKDLGDFSPAWVKNYNPTEPIEYLNLKSDYSSALYYNGKIVDLNDNIHVWGSTAVVLCKNTYHNAINIIKNGSEYTPF